MRRVQRLCAAVVMLSLMLSCVCFAQADTDCREKLLKYYCAGASGQVASCLQTLEAEDPVQGKLWRRIMEDWDRLNHAGYDSRRALSDRLAQDDSLCIVVFGFGLNQDGTMKPELRDRLQAALNAAQQYPNAYVAVTGGQTSKVAGITEACVMAIWLMNHGISDDRIIIERDALSTTENAQNTYRILERDYPQVRQLVVVTSDYHVAFAATMLQTVSTYESAMHATREIPVVAGISCATGTPNRNMLSSQAWGIALITGTPWGSAEAEPAAAAPEEDTEVGMEADLTPPEEPAGAFESFGDSDYGL